MAGENIYFTGAYGDQKLLIADIDTDGGRDIAVQSPSRGDRHVLQDRGRKMRSTTVEILFIDQPGLDPYTQRYEAFRDLVNQPDSQIFTHPLDGSYRARASDLRTRTSADTLQIQCTCTFLAEDEPQTVFPVGAGTSPVAGLEATTTASASANTELAGVGLSSSAPASALAAVTSWSTSDDLDSQEVYAQLASLTQQIADDIDALELAQDITRWQAYQAMINLHFQLTRAAEAFTADSGQLFDLTIIKQMPLLAICAQVYGGALATDRAPKIAKLNRVRTPGLVRAGTTLKMLPRTS